jgi:cephalosporin-C deacetylase-like acetyl esterase
MKIFDPFLNGYCNVHVQLWDYLVNRTLDALHKQEHANALLKSPGEIAARGRAVRDAFLESIGGLPPRDTPLNARTVGIVARTGYHIEKVIFESQPKVYVTALLYVPDVMNLPAPGVLFVCGHGREAKAYDQYQMACHDIALNGMVALAVDPTGQGERVTTLDPETRQMSHGWGTEEHAYQGLQCAVTGTGIARYFLHDDLRGLDYLASRPEVDPKRIGVTGNSGGGLQTTLICMSGEEGIAAAVPCTYVTSREDYLRTGQPQDAEQLQFGMNADGINYDDMFYAFAPRPLSIGAVRSDFFSPEGTKLTHERLQKVYETLGKPENLGLSWAPGTHKYHAELRQAMVNWFRVHLLGAAPDFKTAGDDNIEILPDEQLWCTSKGHVLTDYPDARTPYHLNLDLIRPRPAYANADALRNAVVETLSLKDRVQNRCDLIPRSFSTQEADGLSVESVSFRSEPGLMVAGALAYPSGAEFKDAVLYLADGGTEKFDERLPKIRELTQGGRAVLLLDVRGLGAVKANPVNAFADSPFFDTEGWFASVADCLGESLLGMRVFDVLRGFDYLRDRGCTTLAIQAEGLQPALWGYLAAAIDAGVSKVKIDGLIESYEAFARAQFYNKGIVFSTLAHGILQRFDLPELCPLFDGRTLEVTTIPATETA